MYKGTYAFHGHIESLLYVGVFLYVHKKGLVGGKAHCTVCICTLWQKLTN